MEQNDASCYSRHEFSNLEEQFSQVDHISDIQLDSHSCESTTNALKNALETLYGEDCTVHDIDQLVQDNTGLENERDAYVFGESNAECPQPDEQTNRGLLVDNNQMTSLSRSNLQRIIDTLSSNKEAERLHGWSGKTVEELRNLFRSKSACTRFFRKFELVICMEVIYCNAETLFHDNFAKMTKPEIVQHLVNLHFEIGVQKTSRTHPGRKRVHTLQSMCSQVLERQNKYDLAKIVAANIWTDVHDDWKGKGPIPQNIKIASVEDKPIEWFS
jgi:hypothetical protein